MREYKESENASIKRLLFILVGLAVVVGYFAGAFDNPVATRHGPRFDANDVAPLIANSDDIERRRDVFTKAAIELLDSRRCSRTDFTENGGFVRSTNHPGGIYFIYCGGFTVSDRIYVDYRGDIWYRNYPL